MREGLQGAGHTLMLPQRPLVAQVLRLERRLGGEKGLEAALVLVRGDRARRVHEDAAGADRADAGRQDARLDGGEALDVRAEYRSVTARGGFERRTVAVTADVDAGLDALVQSVADAVGAGVFLPEPGEYDYGGYQHCRLCDYDRVCATSRAEAWERKRGEAGR